MSADRLVDLGHVLHDEAHVFAAVLVGSRRRGRQRVDYHQRKPNLRVALSDGADVLDQFFGVLALVEVNGPLQQHKRRVSRERNLVMLTPRPEPLFHAPRPLPALINHESFNCWEPENRLAMSDPESDLGCEKTFPAAASAANYRSIALAQPPTDKELVLGTRRI